MLDCPEKHEPVPVLNDAALCNDARSINSIESLMVGSTFKRGGDEMNECDP